MKHGNIYNTTIHKEGTCPEVLPRQQPKNSRYPLDEMDSPMHTAEDRTTLHGLSNLKEDFYPSRSKSNSGRAGRTVKGNELLEQREP